MTDLVTPEDRDWLDSLGKASIPTSYSHLDERFRVNHVAGRRAKDIMDVTTDQLRRLGTTPNTLVADTFKSNPKFWTELMENMSVVFCNDERNHTPGDMKIVLGIMLRELNEIPNDKKRDYHRIMIRCLTKYLINNKDGLSLDQCFGLENVRSKERSPYDVPNVVFDAVNYLVFYHDYYPDIEGLPDKTHVYEILKEQAEEAYCEENKLDWFEDNVEYPKGLFMSESSFNRQFSKHRFYALNEVFRERLIHKPHKIVLDEEQLHQLYKYWDKIEFPETIEFLDKTIFK